MAIKSILTAEVDQKAIIFGGIKLQKNTVFNAKRQVSKKK